MKPRFVEEMKRQRELKREVEKIDEKTRQRMTVCCVFRDYMTHFTNEQKTYCATGVSRKK
jgi:hypothetical protein